MPGQDEYLRGLFEAQKIHIDYRFDELARDLKECNTCHTEVEKTLAGEIKDLKNTKRKQYIISGLGGVFGGAFMVVFNWLTGGIFRELP